MKKFIYIALWGFLGLILSFILHAIIEIIYIDWAEKSNLVLNSMEVFGKYICFLPLWLIYLLPILGLALGIYLGFFFFKKVYIIKS